MELCTLCFKLVLYILLGLNDLLGDEKRLRKKRAGTVSSSGKTLLDLNTLALPGEGIPKTNVSKLETESKARDVNFERLQSRMRTSQICPCDNTRSRLSRMSGKFRSEKLGPN